MDRLIFVKETLDSATPESDCDQVADSLKLRDILQPMVPTDLTYDAEVLKYGFAVSGSEGSNRDFVLAESIRALSKFARICASPEWPVFLAKTTDAKRTLKKTLSAAAKVVPLTNPPVMVVLTRNDSIVFECVLTAEAHRIKAARAMLRPEHEPLLQELSRVTVYSIRPDGIATTSIGLLLIADPDLIRSIDGKLGRPIDIVLDVNKQVVRSKLMTLHGLRSPEIEENSEEALLAAA